MPIGIASMSQRMTPPNTSDAVTGARLEDQRVDRLAVGTSAEARRLEVRAADETDGHQASDELAVLHVDRPVGAEVVRDARDLGLACGLAAGGLRRVRGDEVEEDVADDGDGEEEHDRPQQAPDQIPDPSSRRLPLVVVDRVA